MSSSSRLEILKDMHRLLMSFSPREGESVSLFLEEEKLCPTKKEFVLVSKRKKERVFPGREYLGEAFFVSLYFQRNIEVL